jgi:ketosteroid isomerase-like protein
VAEASGGQVAKPVRLLAMGEAEVRLFETWLHELAAADQPLDVWYDHIWAEDIDHRAIEGAPDDIGPILGRDAMRRYLEDWYEMFPDLVVEPAELIDIGPERVIVVWHVAGTAEQSGVPTELRLSIVYTIRDGRIVHSREYQTKDEALAAAAGGERP